MRSPKYSASFMTNKTVEPSLGLSHAIATEGNGNVLEGFVFPNKRGNRNTMIRVPQRYRVRPGYASIRVGI